MTKTRLDLVKEVCQRTGIEHITTALIVEASLDAIRDFVIAGDNVQLRGFGTFGRKSRRARPCRDIGRGILIHIPEHDIPVFKPVRDFTVAVANIPEIK